MQDLAKARECFVMTSELHITYLVTPIAYSVWGPKGPDWKIVYKKIQELNVSMLGSSAMAS